MDIKHTLSLFEVSQRIKGALESEFPSTVWVIGEISEIKANPSGHCYLELVEKESDTDQPKAKARATIWARNFRMIKPFFETSTGRRLSSGIKVLVQCVISYHPVYGLSLNVLDIDPAFTIGDLEMARQQTINRLIAEGVMEMNKEIPMPLLPKRIAVVSSPTAAGFEDFANQLHTNPYGFVFFVKLFAATMQGEKAEESIISALDRIHNKVDEWDVVAIIRGGGSLIDLGCFDSYNLANNIAQFPIPIVTGIGHEKDVTIADMVANTRQKTPTAVAELFINHFINAENWLVEANDNFSDAVKQVIGLHVQNLSKLSGGIIPSVLKSTRFENLRLQRLYHLSQEEVAKQLNKRIINLNKLTTRVNAQVRLTSERNRITIMNIQRWLAQWTKNRLSYEAKDLIQVEKTVYAINPENVLKRGYSLTLFQGKILKNWKEVKPDDEVKTILASGQLVSVIKYTNKTKL